MFNLVGLRGIRGDYVRLGGTMYEFVRLGGDYERRRQTELSGFIVSVKK